MKEYVKPEVEVIEFSSETIADVDSGITSSNQGDGGFDW